MTDKIKSLKKTRQFNRHREYSESFLILSHEESQQMCLGSVEVETETIYDYLSKVSQVRESMKKMRLTLEKIRTQFQVILTTPASDHEDHKHSEKLLSNFKGFALQINISIKEIEDQSGQGATSGQMTVSQRIRKGQHSSLRKEFLDIMTDYSAIMEDYRSKSRNLIKRQLLLSQRRFTEDQVEEIIENPDTNIFTQEICTDCSQLQEALGAIHSRNNQLLILQETMKELQDMFVALSAIIDEQGETFNNIEHCIAATQDHVSNAVNIMTRIEPSTTVNRKLSCWIITCTVITVIIFVVIIIALLIILPVRLLS